MTHRYIITDRHLVHATVTSVIVGRIAFSDDAQKPIRCYKIAKTMKLHRWMLSKMTR